MASSAETPAKKLKIIKVKRKASDGQNSQLLFGGSAKRFKFIGSSQTGDEETIKELIVEKGEINVDESKDFEISDLADFIAKYKKRVRQFPKTNEVVTVNGTRLISAPSNLNPLADDGKDSDDEGKDKYIYDIYCDDGSDHGNEQVLLHDVDMGYREVYDEENDSNDEENEANEYPDEDSDHYREYDQYRDDWLDDETRDMLDQFDRYNLPADGDEESGSEC